MANSVVFYLQYSDKMKLFNEFTLNKQNALLKQEFQSTEGVVKYTEYITGKKTNRPELFKAVEYAKKCNAVIAMATLLSFKYRPEHLREICNAGILLWVAEIGYIFSETLEVLIRQFELEQIHIEASRKNAFKQRKEINGEWRTGLKLNGEPCLGENERKTAIAMLKRKAITNEYTVRLMELMPEIIEQREKGISLNTLAAKYTAEGHRSPRGNSVSPVHLLRLIERYENEQK
jgi:hypothetical protein